ncbi:MAG: alpha/beta hydrolase-fold protein [Bacillota bacterium]|nr:alpha/beta hydrolase-fold protein [Bacillota bacterium]MDW7677280.1 alpha/beta hydrolase-fold protein [Bacillota bacterium]
MIPTEPSNILPIHRFYSRSLKNFRSLYVYLPPSYPFQPDRQYPVLYMHDGQNIFDGSLSYSGDGWEIHRIADELISLGMMEEILIVGISHQHDQRLNEYAHVDGAYEGSSVKGKGLLYESFLLEDVKPFIEANFRVLAGREHTGLMGSSMGGLVTFQIGLRHPSVFGKLGVLSPSFWWNPPKTLRLIERLPKKNLPTRLWIDMGEAEGPLMDDFSIVLNRLRKKGIKPQDELACWMVPEGTHSETAWMNRVYCPLLYLFGETGVPKQLVIDGSNQVSLQASRRRILLTAVYTTGFCLSPHPARFTSSRPGVLTVGPDQTLHPHRPGETIITASWAGLKESRRYSVVT